MTDSQTHDVVPPVVCTLTDKALVERGLEWADLRELAVDAQAMADGAVSIYPLDLAEQIEDLVHREDACCGSWLDSSVTTTTEHVRLELTTANPEGLALIRAMSGLDQA